MEKYMKELGYDPQDFMIRCLQMVFSHVYYIWKVYKKELGVEKALKTYGVVWDSIAAVSFAQAVQTLGIKKVEDMATLGRIVELCAAGVPAIYETVENTSDRHVGHVLWCANPEYGPRDCIYSRQEYYRNAEIPLTYAYLATLVSEAKKMGLKGEVEISVPAGRCRDGEASFCQWHLWRKGTPKVEKEVDPGKKYIEDEMGDEEPAPFVLRKQGKKLEDVAPGMLLNVVFVDMKAWDGLQENVGITKGTDIYKKLWMTYAPIWVKEAKLELEIGKVEQLETLGQLIAYCEKKRFAPYQVTAKGDEVILSGKMDPFAEIPIEFLGKTHGDKYFEAIAQADQAFINQVLQEVGMSSKVKVTEKKRLLRGDGKNEILLENK